jgi:HPt (histidine-containing phosphotransfer) domain-containing protein
MFLENGFNDFLSKPIDTVALNYILERWLPKEKQIDASAAKTDDAAPVETVSVTTAEIEAMTAARIEGLNVEAGIAHMEGMKDLYIEVLSTFCEDGLERVNRMKKCLADGSYELYNTNVHALKSMCANIGADGLSKLAKRLEEAGRRKDLSFVKKNTPDFTSSMETLVGKISAVMSNFAKPSEARNSAAFRNELMSLKAAVEGMQSSLMTGALDNLQKMALPAEAAAAVRNISNSILLAEYDEAVKQIDSLLKL